MSAAFDTRLCISSHARTHAHIRAAAAGEGSIWAARRHRWREALTNCYFALRASRDGCLMYCVFEGEFVVLICGPGLRGHAEAHALVSRSTQGLRELLADGEKGLLVLSDAH